MSENRDIINIIQDPCKDVFISLLISSVSFESFDILYKNLFECCDNKNTEILVKIDNILEINKYYDLLINFNTSFKILIYNKLYGRLSNHIFFNDLSKISNGKLIWPIYEDLSIVKGNWFISLKNIYDNKIYKDNIYNIALPMDNGKGTKQICGANIITKEWRDFFGVISPFPNLDRWLRELSVGIGRYIGIDEKNLLTHFPPGNRTLSKEERKKFFYPEIKKYIQLFNLRK